MEENIARGDKTRQFTLHKQVQGKVKIELKTERENAKEKSAEINFFLPLSSTLLHRERDLCRAFIVNCILLRQCLGLGRDDHRQ